jgi:hypothetical protein
MYILGFDIGGTKCAALVAEWDGENVRVLDKVRLKTDTSIPASEMIHRLIDAADGILTKKPEAIGISSGGPLDSERGVIMSPPNLPGWDNVEIVGMMEGHYGVKARLLDTDKKGKRSILVTNTTSLTFRLRRGKGISHELSPFQSIYYTVDKGKNLTVTVDNMWIGDHKHPNITIPVE